MYLASLKVIAHKRELLGFWSKLQNLWYKVLRKVLYAAAVSFPTQKLAWEQQGCWRGAFCQENHYFPTTTLPLKQATTAVWLGRRRRRSALLFNINWCCLVLDPTAADPLATTVPTLWTCTTVACVSNESFKLCSIKSKATEKVMQGILRYPFIKEIGWFANVDVAKAM